MSTPTQMTREERRSLKAEFHYLCELSNEARRLLNEMDYQYGLAILDGDSMRMAKCKRIKRMASARHHRRSCKANAVYEEMEA